MMKKILWSLAAILCFFSLPCSLAWAEEEYVDLTKTNMYNGPDFDAIEAKQRALPDYVAQEQKDALRNEEQGSGNALLTDGQGQPEVRKKRKGKKMVDQSKLPITIYGDHLVYHNDSGEFTADGNVRIYQGQQFMLTEHAEGNMRSGDVYITEGGTMSDGKTISHGAWGHYNLKEKYGKVTDINGREGSERFRAPVANLYPGKVVMSEGGATSTCEAVEHPKCIDIQAQKVILYPKWKMVAYGVKVFVRGKHVYSRDRWINYFQKEDRFNPWPHVGWSKAHHWEFTWNINRHLSDKDTLNLDFIYYSRRGYRPDYTLLHNERNWSLKYRFGFEEDSNENWIKKQNDFYFSYKPHYFTKKIPVRYSAYYEHGLWKDDRYKSWHTEYGVYLTHNRVKFGKHPRALFLDMMVGHQWKKESINDLLYKTWIYKVQFGKNLGAGWNSWLGYYYQKTENSVFQYNLPDMARELQWGISKRFDSRNSLGFTYRYDEGKKKPYEFIVYYRHRFCCLDVDLQFRHKMYDISETSNRNEISVHVNLLNF